MLLVIRGCSVSKHADQKAVNSLRLYFPPSRHVPGSTTGSRARRAMPPYDAPAGSFRSSMRSARRYDDPETDPYDDGSDTGSDVTQSEWGIDARNFAAPPGDKSGTTSTRRGEVRYTAPREDEAPVTAKQQYEQRGPGNNKEPENALTGWGAVKRYGSVKGRNQHTDRSASPVFRMDISFQPCDSSRDVPSGTSR